MSTVEIPTRADYPDIARIVNAADAPYAKIYTRDERELYGVSNMTVEKLCAYEGARRYRVVKRDGKIVAWTSFRLRDAATLWVSFLFVEPTEQRNGFGGMLLAEVEKEARRCGAHAVALATHARALWAISFYVKQGYVMSRTLNSIVAENRIAFEKYM